MTPSIFGMDMTLFRVGDWLMRCYKAFTLTLRSSHMPSTRPLKNTALVLVDIQNDFLPPNGSLAVTGARNILPCVTTLLNEYRWDLVVASSVRHPPGHISFASAHPGRKPFDSIKVPVPNQEPISQMLWPDHCVPDTWGAQFEDSVQRQLTRLEQSGTKVEVIRKGKDINVDSYSGFADIVYSSFTDMAKVLYQNDVGRLVMVGVATDFCVVFTANDARKFGFETLLITDGTAAVFPENEEKTIKEMRDRGVKTMTLKEFQALDSSKNAAL
ncbi:NAD(+) salvage pathway protein [Tulasnella sp. JGI-2019a]|nr:NAD(+) salvage pathway protein [Tulasnella sp. JGI-2019a]KAG9015735.1 NAD(+) salvage pathway protein [Tulasnella sp. JGI-2019a]